MAPFLRKLDKQGRAAGRSAGVGGAGGGLAMEQDEAYLTLVDLRTWYVQRWPQVGPPASAGRAAAELWSKIRPKAGYPGELLERPESSRVPGGRRELVAWLPGCACVLAASGGWISMFLRMWGGTSSAAASL